MLPGPIYSFNAIDTDPTGSVIKTAKFSQYIETRCNLLERIDFKINAKVIVTRKHKCYKRYS